MGPTETAKGVLGSHDSQKPILDYQTTEGCGRIGSDTPSYATTDAVGQGAGEGG